MPATGPCSIMTMLSRPHLAVWTCDADPVVVANGSGSEMFKQTSQLGTSPSPLFTSPTLGANVVCATKLIPGIRNCRRLRTRVRVDPRTLTNGRYNNFRTHMSTNDGDNAFEMASMWSRGRDGSENISSHDKWVLMASHPHPIGVSMATHSLLHLQSVHRARPPLSSPRYLVRANGRALLTLRCDGSISGDEIPISSAFLPSKNLLWAIIRPKNTTTSERPRK